MMGMKKLRKLQDVDANFQVGLTKDKGLLEDEIDMVRERLNKTQRD